VTLPADPPQLRHVDESIWRVYGCVTEIVCARVGARGLAPNGRMIVHN